MDITPIQNVAFDDAATLAMGEAFDQACQSLRNFGSAYTVREIIAKRIIDAAKNGERDPARPHEQALKAFRIEDMSMPSVLTPKALRVNKIDIGMRVVDDIRRGGTTVRDVPEESLMLTGDENIVDVDFSVLWKVKPTGVGEFLFNIQNPEGTVKAVAESAMREVIGRSEIQPILTGARQTIETAVQDLMQKTLDHYGAGVIIQQVQLQKVDPPAQVIDAFRDVQAARADLERAVNESQTYANRVVPEARGRVAQITQAAEAYKSQTVAEATGQTSRFLKIYEEYKKAPDVTRERMYLETMERVLGGTDKIILDSNSGGTGVVPYLPLGELTRPPQPRPQPQAGGRQ
jgi:modulator of FtsH protease HflK